MFVYPYIGIKHVYFPCLHKHNLVLEIPSWCALDTSINNLHSYTLKYFQYTTNHTTSLSTPE